MFNKKIVFCATDDGMKNIWPNPKPASHFIPKEYKELVKEQKKQELLLLETEQETVEAITDESLNNQADQP